MSLARLLQLASPTLPVGAYSYSQGLEAAIEAGIVADAESAQAWIADVLELSLARLEAPLLRAMLGDMSAERRQELNDFFVATRESAELRAETLQMGQALSKLFEEVSIETPAYPTAFALAVRRWEIEPRQAVVAYLWSWLENQVMAAVKAVPLGQTAGQKILLELGARLEAIATQDLPQEAWSNFAPGLAMLSARHETQYSRLFRS